RRSRTLQGGRVPEGPEVADSVEVRVVQESVSRVWRLDLGSQCDSIAPLFWGPVSVTIRKKILLFAALALGAFLAAVYFASRFALLNGLARLESSYAREKVHHLQDALADEQARVAIMARDYAQWDRTYDFMQNQSADYVRTELTDDTFNIIHINIFLLIDRNGKVILQKGMGGWSLQSSD